MMQGVIKRWNRERGFGFLKVDGGADVFLHASELKKAGLTDEVSEGDRFSFETERGDKGPRAINVSQNV